MQYTKPIFKPTLLFLFLFLTPLLADHGPATTGASSNVLDARLVPARHIDVAITTNLTTYQTANRGDIRELTESIDRVGAHVDFLPRSQNHNVILTWGITDRWEVSLQQGWYQAAKLYEGLLDFEKDYRLIDAGRIAGHTDLVTGVRRLLSSTETSIHTAGLAVILPTGFSSDATETVKLDSITINPQLQGGNFHLVPGTNFGTGGGDFRVEPALMPGGGAFGIRPTFASLFPLDPDSNLLVSAGWTYMFPGNDAQLPMRLDLGAGIETRLGKVIFTQDATFRWQGKNSVSGEIVQNSGGTYLFYSPGIRVVFNERWRMFMQPQWPVWQSLAEPQNPLQSRWNAGLIYTWHGETVDPADEAAGKRYGEPQSSDKPDTQAGSKDDEPEQDASQSR